MKAFYSFIAILILVLFASTAEGQFTVTGSTLADGSYTSLTAATTGVFAKINATAQTGNNIIITVTGNSTTETGAMALTGAAGMWTTLKIYTNGTWIISTSSIANPLIDLSGAKNITIDGRVGQTGSTIALTLEATGLNNNSRTIRFRNDASSNTIQYCKITGACPSSGAGVIFFSTTTGTTGNDGNTIDNCEITSSTARPYNVIFSSGTASKENSGNIISNNKIYDFFNSCTASYGIQTQANTDAWTISGNSFYETGSFVPTASVAYNVIYIYAGNNYNISGNYIGGSLPQCGGTAWTKTNAFDNTFNAILFYVGTTTASNVQGNTIANFNWSNSAAALWQGIYVIAGAVNVGTTTGNTIGASTGTGSITLTNGTPAGYFRGIYYSGAGTGNIQNNIIGSITTNNSAANSTYLYGIYIAGTGAVNISNNTIGSTSTANSINASSASTGIAQNVIGIISTGVGCTITISGNAIANIKNSCTYTSGYLSGIYTSNTGSYTISNNTIHDLTNANASEQPTSQASVCGISQSSTGTSGQSVSGNTIYNLTNTHSTAAVNVIGIFYGGPTTASTSNIFSNFIYGLSISTSSTSAKIKGIHIDNTSGALLTSIRNIYNNIVSLGTGISNDCEITGLYEYTSGLNTNNFYFNTVYIGGVASGTPAKTTYAFGSPNPIASTKDIRDNILVNARTGGTNLHYSIYLNTTTNITINFNDYYTTSGTFLCKWSATNYTTLATWKAAVIQDANSLNLDPIFADPDVNGTAPGDFQSTNSSLNGTGVTITGYSTDYNGYTRPSPPSIGGIENDNPLPVQLSSFSSSLKGRDVVLNWKTDKEINNAGFNIERAEVGSQKLEFSKIGFVTGHGTVNTPTNYSFEDRKLQTGKYKYRLKQMDVNGNFEYFALNGEVEIGVPAEFELGQNYPNPFNPATNIDFELPFDGKVYIVIFDITGREVKTLLNEPRTAGFHTIRLNASDLSSGMYFYRILVRTADKDYFATKKMAVIK